MTRGLTACYICLMKVGPKTGLTRQHLRIVMLVVGGTAFLVAGLMGYDTGRKDVRLPRWFEPPLWDQIILGAVLFGAAAFDYRLLRRRQRDSSK